MGNLEIDFIVIKDDEKKYIQVTMSMLSEDVRDCKLAPLMRVKDNYEKIILSLKPGLDDSYEGIKSLNVVDRLLDEE